MDTLIKIVERAALIYVIVAPVFVYWLLVIR
jgi:hypothetical protein